MTNGVPEVQHTSQAALTFVCRHDTGLDGHRAADNVIKTREGVALLEYNKQLRVRCNCHFQSLCQTGG